MSSLARSITASNFRANTIAYTCAVMKADGRDDDGDSSPAIACSGGGGVGEERGRTLARCQLHAAPTTRGPPGRAHEVRMEPRLPREARPASSPAPSNCAGGLTRRSRPRVGRDDDPVRLAATAARTAPHADSLLAKYSWIAAKKMARVGRGGRRLVTRRWNHDILSLHLRWGILHRRGGLRRRGSVGDP